MNSIDAESLWARAIVLVVVAIGITVLVYGAVGVLVKMDDVGLAMAADDDSEVKQKFGRGLVGAMPKVMNVISYVGMVAMLWVGGHILLVGTHDLGLAQPYGFVHHLEGAVAGIAGVGAILGWLINTAFSFVFGLIIGGIIAVILHVLPFGHHDEDGHAEGGHAGDSAGPHDTAPHGTVENAEGSGAGSTSPDAKA